MSKDFEHMHQRLELLKFVDSAPRIIVHQTESHRELDVARPIFELRSRIIVGGTQHFSVVVF